MKKLLILTTIILLNSSSAMAVGILPTVPYPAPNLIFKRREPISPKNDNINGINTNTYYSDVFLRTLGYTEKDLLDETLRLYGGFVKIVKRDLPNKFSQQYRMISIMPKPDENGILNLVKKQGSIFVNNEVIGYYTLSPTSVALPNTDSTYLKMKALTLNTNYLAGKLTIPEGTQVKAYETEHLGYIERYVTYIYPNNGVIEEYLLGELFYPKELDGEFDSKIINAINSFTYRIDIITKYDNKLIPFSVIEQEFKTPLGDMEY